MKLWQKIFLSSLALLVLATGGLSLLFLNNTQTQLWQREKQRAALQQQSMMNAIKTNVVNQRLQSGQISLSDTETRQAVRTPQDSHETATCWPSSCMIPAARAFAPIPPACATPPI